MNWPGDYKNQIICWGCIEAMRDLPDNSIDLVLTDPPYGYSFMGKDWDKAVPNIKVWQECLRVLKAGAWCLVMSAPRQDVLSRMMVNLEEAGFRTDFTSIYWTYATGFPKAGNIGKMVDKKLGAERKVVGKKPTVHRGVSCDQEYGFSDKGMINITVPATPQAKALDGSYAGFQPKPAVEVIIVAMKPLDEKTYVEQAMKNGKGVTWLDDCRVPSEKEVGARISNKDGISRRNLKFGMREFAGNPTQGRFPANLLVSDDVLNDGKVTKSGVTIQPEFTSKNVQGFQPNPKAIPGFNQHKDSGSFSRYFNLDAWDKGARDTFPFLIVPKASKSEKNRGLEKTPQEAAKPDYGSEGYEKTAEESARRVKAGENFHPTVKPLKLFRYLITLTTRQGDIVLDPFVGSGTTCVAAQELGRQWIGMDVSPEYCEIAEKRIVAVEGTLFGETR